MLMPNSAGEDVSHFCDLAYSSKAQVSPFLTAEIPCAAGKVYGDAHHLGQACGSFVDPQHVVEQAVIGRGRLEPLPHLGGCPHIGHQLLWESHQGYELKAVCAVLHVHTGP